MKILSSSSAEVTFGIRVFSPRSADWRDRAEVFRNDLKKCGKDSERSFGYPTPRPATIAINFLIY